MDVLQQHLDKLPVFCEAVRQGSIRSAAKSLGRSQPSVTRLIQLLEDAIGQRLLLRTKDGVSLTPTGQRVFDFARKLHTDIEELRREVEGTTSSHREVTLGSYDTIGIYLFPGFVRYCQAACADLQLNLFTERSDVLMDALLRSQVDLIVSVAPGERRNVDSARVFTDEYRVYRNPTVELAASTPIAIVPAAWDNQGRTLAERIAGSEHSRRRQFRSTSFELVLALTSQGIGLGVLPSRVAQRALCRGELVEVGEDGEAPWRFGTHDVCVSRLSHRRDDRDLDEVSELLRRYESDSAASAP